MSKDAMRSKRNYNRSTYTIEGNTVRRTAPAGDQPRRSQPGIREKRRADRAAGRTRRNRERALYMSPGYVIFLSVCACSLFAICGLYINLRAQVSDHMSTVTAMEAELVDMRSDNDETQLELETSINLDQIKDKAFALGMQYPESDQIVYYSVEESDVMTQYQTAEE
ncbi:MAG: hypothetical protein K5840_06185 [Eubacterium sp.]|nr:hypothetical protein [Eubacterium sp.]